MAFHALNRQFSGEPKPVTASAGQPILGSHKAIWL